MEPRPLSCLSIFPPLPKWLHSIEGFTLDKMNSAFPVSIVQDVNVERSLSCTLVGYVMSYIRMSIEKGINLVYWRSSRD